MRELIIFVLLSYFSSNLLAKANEIRKSKLTDLNLEVSIGDKVSKFHIWQSDKKNYFKFNDTFGKLKEGSLNSKDYNFILTKVTSILNEKSNDMSFCYRNNMSLVVTKNAQIIE